jgi:hypothetical protein
MTCKACGSRRLSKFDAELCIHRGGLEELGQPPKIMFPTLTACLSCGFAEFKIDESELCMLNESMAA